MKGRKFDEQIRLLTLSGKEKEAIRTVNAALNTYGNEIVDELNETGRDKLLALTGVMIATKALYLDLSPEEKEFVYKIVNHSVTIPRE